MKIHVYLIALLYAVITAQAQIPAFPTNGICTNCPITYPVLSITNDPLIHYVSNRFYPIHPTPNNRAKLVIPNYANSWMYYYTEDTNRVAGLFSTNGFDAPILEPALGTNWHLDLKNAWCIQPDADRQLLVIIDTGVDVTHADLSNNISSLTPAHWRSDYNGHGTRVAGLAAAVGGNSNGLAGVARLVQVLPIKSSLEVSEVATQIVWSVKAGATVICLPFGYTNASIYPTSVVAAIQYAGSSNVSVVVAARNQIDNNDAATDWLVNANLDNVISVTGHTRQGVTNGAMGTNITVSAPNYRLTSTSTTNLVALGYTPSGHVGELRGNQYLVDSGNSFGAGLVAGAVCLVRERYPYETASYTKLRFQHCGGVSGPLNVYRALTWNPYRSYLAIDRYSVSFSRPPGSTMELEISTNLVDWTYSPYQPATATGFPEVIGVAGTNAISTLGNLVFFRKDKDNHEEEGYWPPELYPWIWGQDGRIISDP